MGAVRNLKDRFISPKSPLTIFQLPSKNAEVKSQGREITSAEGKRVVNLEFTSTKVYPVFLYFLPEKGVFQPVQVFRMILCLN